jgi:hypothetical protein
MILSQCADGGLHLHLERRQVLKQAVWLSSQAATAGGLLVAGFYSAEAEIEQSDRSKIIEAWMDEWMKRDRDVVGALHLSRFADPIYFLLKPITWKPNADQTGYQAVSVPVGFVTDFASIPRPFWSIFRPDGLYTYPAIVHDYLYWTQITSKVVADKIFQFGMEDFGVSPANIAILHTAVNLAGNSAWSENARLKASGEKRTLKVFPDDPRTLWEVWKKNSEHFV